MARRGIGQIRVEEGKFTEGAVITGETTEDFLEMLGPGHPAL
jgi:hypothetical protein